MLRIWLLPTFCAASIVAALPSAAAKECRRDEVPPGVRLPEQAGCKAPAGEHAGGQRRAPVRAGREPGFIDLGNGTQVRISGQVGVEAGHRR